MLGKDFIKLAWMTALDPIRALQRMLAPKVRQVAVEVKFVDLNRLFDFSTNDWYQYFGHIRSCSSVEPVFASREDAHLILNILVQLRTNSEICTMAESWVREGLDTDRFGEYEVVAVKVLGLIKIPRAKRQPEVAETLGEFVASDVMYLLADHIRALTNEFVITDTLWDEDASKLICGPLTIKIVEDGSGCFWVHIIQAASGESEHFMVTSIGSRHFKKTLREMAIEAGAEFRNRPTHEF